MKLKKLLLVGALIVGGFAAFKFGSVAVHNATSENQVASWKEIFKKKSGHESVEKTIAQMRKDVAGLDKDIDHVKDELAKEIVEVRELTGKTNDLRASVDTEQKVLMARGEAVKDATEKVKYGNTMISITDAKERLKRDVSNHVKRKTQLDAMEKALGHRERIKDTLEKQLDGLLKQKQEVKVEIEAIEAEYKALQLQQIESKYQTDDSKLAKVKEDLRGLRKKLDIEREKLALTPSVQEDRPVTPTSAESVEDILAPLNK